MDGGISNVTLVNDELVSTACASARKDIVGKVAEAVQTIRLPQGLKALQSWGNEQADRSQKDFSSVLHKFVGSSIFAEASNSLKVRTSISSLYLSF